MVNFNNPRGKLLCPLALKNQIKEKHTEVYQQNNAQTW